MPLYWTIDSKERLFTGSGEGEVTFADAMALLDALAGSGALSYRKLFDGRAVQSSMTGEEVLMVCAKIRTYHAQGPVGALAIVCTPEQTVTFAPSWVHSLPPIGPSRCFRVRDKRTLGLATREANAFAATRTTACVVPATNSPTVRSFVCLAPSGNTPRPSLR